jgi:hypothetical protein
MSRLGVSIFTWSWSPDQVRLRDTFFTVGGH